MFSKKSVKPLELVVSAIHCLGEKKGSSPQNILGYLVEKYNVDSETLKPHVHTGLKRGMSFGMIIQQSGLYRLNNTLSNSELLNFTKIRKPQRTKLRKRSKTVKRRQIRHIVGKKGKRQFLKSACSPLQQNKRKIKKVNNKRKKIGGLSRPMQNDMRKRKQKRQTTKGKQLKQRIEKTKKVGNETEEIKLDGGDGEKLDNAKDGEPAKSIVKK